jgi:hypothetical protein
MKAYVSLLFGILLGVALAGCKSTGEGMGESHTGDVKVSFMWEQSAPTSGTMRATVTQPGGQADTYQGKFYQITKDTHIQTIGGLWEGWYPGLGGWAFWGGRRRRIRSPSTIPGNWSPTSRVRTESACAASSS